MELVRLVKKYPGGTPSRWEVIAEMMNRSVQEITFMAAKMKENGYKVPGQSESVAEHIVEEAAKKVRPLLCFSVQCQSFTQRNFLPVLLQLKAKRPNNPIIVPETTWTQEQQQLLELAIVKYPKTTAGDRWAKIANSIPGKTKEECLARYKHLVEIVKAQKERTKTDEPSTTSNQVIADKVDDEKIEEVTDANDDDETVEPPKQSQNKGKPRNKRKERKNRMDFSSDEDDDYDSN